MLSVPEVSPEFAELAFAVLSLSVIGLLIVGILRFEDSGRRFALSVISFGWSYIGIVLVDILAVKIGWWSYVADGPTFVMSPTAVAIPWALIWGLAPLVVRKVRPLLIAGVFGLVDLLMVPLLTHAVVLESGWLIGEFLLLSLVAFPSALLVRLMHSRERLEVRLSLLVILFTALLLFVIPLLSLELSGVGINVPSFTRVVVAIQVLAFVAIPGIAAVVELAERAGGTPYPADPSSRLVATGPYAYFTNPMQTSGTLILLALAALLWYWPLALAALVSLGFSTTWFSISERVANKSDSKPEWIEYKASHRAWIPRHKPVFRSDYNATIFFDGDCSKCRAVGEFFAALDPTQIDIKDARFASGDPMCRLTYRWWIGSEPDWDDLDVGTDNHVWGELQGVRAFSAGLDHVGIFWASLFWVSRIWPVSVPAQFIADRFIEAPHAAKRPTDANQKPWIPQRA